MTTLVHLLGPTCAGKTTICDHLDTLDNVATVQVGKMFRAKYPPEYFQGQAAPAHTANEAMQMYRDGVVAAINAGKALIVIDGQPRDTEQAKTILRMWPGLAVRYVLVHALLETREERARGSRSGTNLKLALDRLEGDYKGLYSVMAELARDGKRLDVVDTGAGFDVQDFGKHLLGLAHRDAHGY